LTLLLAACENLPAGRAPAVVPALTETPVLPTATFTLPPTRRVEPVETLTPTPEFTPITPTVMPTQAFVPVMTLDAVQVERWQKYQTELAKVVLYGYSPEAYKEAFCEWDILGRSGQEVYVWAECVTWEGNRSLPTVIHLETNGSVQKVSVPAINNLTWDSQIRKMFPADVREKFSLYMGGYPTTWRTQELINHLQYRETHPSEPPLIVLSATPAP
jgi:hypothetical protein